MASQTTTLSISPREISNSRATRRLRRSGQVPGILYGGGADALPFTVDERELRHALAARGAVVDEPALIEALSSGRLAGAALDVFATEPLPATSPLRDLPTVLLSPHLAGSTAESVGNLFRMARANLTRALAGAPVHDLVNAADPLVRRRA